jgi:hypothetical protein
MKYQITENGRVTLWTASVKLCKYWWPFSCLYVILTYGRRLQYISIVLIMSVHASESMKLNNIYMRTYTHTHVSCPALLIVAVETVTQAPIGQQSKSSLCLGLHMCTARPPLLRNQVLHAWHWMAPLCLCTDFLLSLRHLCLLWLLSLLNVLEQTSH